MKLVVWLLRGALFVVALGFALSNTGVSELRFFGVDLAWRAPLVVFLLGFFVAGVALGIAGVVPTLFRQRREIGRLRRQLQGATRVPGGSAADPLQVQGEPRA
jgi:putative membrane protein